LLTLFAGVAALGVVLREPLEWLAAWFVGTLGLPGIVLAVTLVDTLPLTHEPVLLLAWSGGVPFWHIWAAASLGSVAAGGVGWGMGRLVGQRPSVQRFFVRYRLADFLERYGAWAVAVAALTPFPYAVATWSAGAARVPLALVLAGSMVRLIKVLVYLSLIVLGWSAGG
jgi:membrane protein YqaA with SNARE-associated domain